MNKKKIAMSVISFLVLVVAIIMVLGWQQSLDEALEHIKSANVWILLLLIPNIVAMYYAVGKIWHPYLKRRHSISAGELASIQYELNFVNTVVPVFALSGLIYATERLREYGVKPGVVGGLYLYRYIVSIATNWVGIIGSAIILLCSGKMHNMSIVPLVITTIIICAALLALVAILLLVTNRIHVRSQRINSYLRELRGAFMMAKSDKKALISSWIWGMIYTILEDTPFLVVALAMGHPELFLQMVVAAAAGIIVGVLIPTPGGIGGFDGAMIYLLGGLGTSIALASAIVLTTRVLVLVGTTITGYPFWQRGMLKIGRSSR